MGKKLPLDKYLKMVAIGVPHINVVHDGIFVLMCLHSICYFIERVGLPSLNSNSSGLHCPLNTQGFRLGTSIVFSNCKDNLLGISFINKFDGRVFIYTVA
jgi:hypothetical protein